MLKETLKRTYHVVENKILQREFLIPILITLPILLKYFIFFDANIIGNDTQTHIYKVIILKEQIKNLPFPLWGSWDWNWYAGYPFLQVYSPLFYYLIAAISLILNLPVSLIIRVSLPFFFSFSALSMYVLAKRFTKDILASAVASAVYVYIPYHVLNFPLYGSLGTFVAFIFLPLALLYADKIENIGDRLPIFATGIFIALTMLSNQAVGLTTSLLISAYLILRKKILCWIMVAIETFLVAAFWLIPYVPYLEGVLLPVRFPEGLLTGLNYVITENAGIISFLVAILAVFTLRKKLMRNKKMFIVCFIFALLLLYNAFVFCFPVSFLTSFTLGRTMSAFALLISLVASFVVILAKNKKQVATVLLVIAIVEGMLLQSYTPLMFDRYVNSGVNKYLSADNEWFRVFFVPREPINSLAPLFINKSIIDGWLDQGSPTANIVHIIGDMRDYSGEPLNTMLIADPSRAVGILGYLGVKYVIVDSANSVHGFNFSRSLYYSINSSKNVEPCHSRDNITIFHLETFSPLIFGTNAIYVDDLQEFMGSITLRTNQNTVLLYRGQEFLLSNSSGDEVNYKIVSITQTYQGIRYEFYVNRAALLVLPISYDESLKLLINGEEHHSYEVPPNIIALPLKSSGTYTVDVVVGMTQLRWVSFVVSLVSFIVILGFSLMNNFRGLIGWTKKS